MKTKKDYFKWGLTVFLTVCAILVFYDVFYKGGTLLGFFNKLTSTLAPVLYGFAMAYLLSPIVNWLERLIRLGWSKWSLTREKTLRRGWLRAVSILITWAIVSYAVYLLMSVLVPQLIDSITTLINNAESYYNQIYDWADNLLKKNPNISPARSRCSRASPAASSAVSSAWWSLRKTSSSASSSPSTCWR